MSSRKIVDRSSGLRVFLSYRREDTQHIAGRLFDRLVKQFGKKQIFKDVDSIPLGDDFREHIRAATGRCDVMLALIGKRWATMTEASGQRRLDNPNDFVRLELESVLERGIPVVPVLVDNAELPAADALPPSLAALAFRQAVKLRPDPDFDPDFARIAVFIQQYARYWTLKRLAAVSAAIVFIAAACLGIYFGWPRPQTSGGMISTKDSAENAAIASNTGGGGPQKPNIEPLRGRLDVYLWDPHDASRQKLSIRDEHARPLHAGDQIRVTAQLNRPAYVYLLWIGESGEVSPVYPWRPGDWKTRAAERPVDRLDLPPELDRGWPMGAGAGMQTLVLLARATQLPANVDLEQLTKGLPPQTMQNASALVEIDGGHVVTDEMERTRAPLFFNAQQIDDPVLRTQQLLNERLSPHFELISAISFANQGK